MKIAYMVAVAGCLLFAGWCAGRSKWVLASINVSSAAIFFSSLKMRQELMKSRTRY